MSDTPASRDQTLQALHVWVTVLRRHLYPTSFHPTPPSRVTPGERLSCCSHLLLSAPQMPTSVPAGTRVNLEDNALCPMLASDSEVSKGKICFISLFL